MEGPDKGTVTSVCKWRDDETRGVTEVLVGVSHCCVGDTDDHIVIFPVVTKMGQPTEVILTGYTCTRENQTFEVYPLILI